MHFQVLGALHALIGQSDILGPGRLQRGLVALLLASANRPVPVDTLTSALWPKETDHRAAARLQLLVHRVRKLLDDPDRIVSGPTGYSLRVGAGELDALDFGDLASAALTDGLTPDEAVDRGRRALDLWRGTPYQDVDLPALEPELRRLADLHLSVLLSVFEGELARGRAEAVLAELDETARAHPWHERVRALEMTALHGAGRQVEALEAYRRTREGLVEELGVEPGPELRELHQRILAGEPLQAGAAAVGPVPAQLPAATAHLVGRDQALAELDVLFPAPGDGPQPSICVITGTAGVGKTTLAVQWAHAHRELFPDGQLFCDLRGFSADLPVAALDALGGFIRALGGETASQALDLADRVATFRSLVSGRRLLILLDNARSAEHVRPLLPGTPGCAVLVTSREQLAGLAVREGASSLTLDRLSDEGAHALLDRLAGKGAPGQDARARLVAQCAHLPLALRIVAQHLRERSPAEADELVREISDSRHRWDLLDAGDGPSTDVRAVLSWSYESLPPSVARLFRHLGVLPGADVDVYGLAALTGQDVGTTRRDVRTLVRAHLLDESAEGRFAQHDLLRAYAAELAEQSEDAETRAAAVRRLLGHQAHTASRAMAQMLPRDPAGPVELRPTDVDVRDFDDPGVALAWLDVECANILSAVRASGPGDGRRVIELSQLLNYYLAMRGHTGDARGLHRAAVEAAQGEGDVRAEARAELALGNAVGRFGNLDDGMAVHSRRSLELSRSGGYRAGEARALNNLATYENMRGRTADGVLLLHQALEIIRELEDPAAEAIILGNIGHNLTELGRYDEAADRLQEALSLSRDHQLARTLGFTLLCLTDLHRQTGDPEQALRYGEEALEVNRSIGHRVREGETQAAIGRALRVAGSAVPALAHCREALRIGRATGEAQLTTEALDELGRIHALDDPRAAVPYFVEAVGVATEQDLARQEAVARLGLADAHDAEGNHSLARPQLERALALHTQLGYPTGEIQARLTQDSRRAQSAPG